MILNAEPRDQNNVIVTNSEVPVLIGFASSSVHSTPSSEHALEISFEALRWGADDTKKLTFAIPPDTDALAEVVVRFPRPVTANHYIPDDSAVTDEMKAQVVRRLRSTDQAGDLFALGFLIMEVFNRCSPAKQSLKCTPGIQRASSSQ